MWSTLLIEWQLINKGIKVVVLLISSSYLKFVFKEFRKFLRIWHWWVQWILFQVLQIKNDCSLIKLIMHYLSRSLVCLCKIRWASLKNQDPLNLTFRYTNSIGYIGGCAIPGYIITSFPVYLCAMPDSLKYSLALACYIMISL